MIRLVVVALVAALGWMVWWAIGQTAYEQGLAAWIADRRAQGWTAEYAELDTLGFPNRFDTTIREVSLADPATGIGWSAPFAQILSLSYRPNQAIAVLPPRHVLTLPGESVTLTQEDARASVFLEASTALALDRARLVVDRLTARSDAGWSLALSAARLAADRVAGAANTYRLGAEATDIALPEGARALLDPGADLPALVGRLRLDATVGLDGPLDRKALEAGMPRIGTVEVADLSLDWGAAGLKADGALTVDAAGFPEGTLMVTAADWRRVLRMAVDLGLVAPDAAGGFETALALIEKPDGSASLPLGFRGGLANLGPIPLGPAPRLR